jgi:DMATS type aromatic prenyltransferase
MDISMNDSNLRKNYASTIFEVSMTKFTALPTGSTSLAEPVGTKVETANSLATHSGIDRAAQIGFNPEQLVPTQTYVEAGVEKLTALADAVGLKDKLPQIIEIFRAMTASWGDRKVGETSAWQSDVSDDSAPFEFSIAFEDDRPELRILLEAHGSNPSLQSNWQAGLELNQYLAEHFNINLDRFQQIEDLFAPTNLEAKFSIWHSACFYPDKEPAFKLYLNPQSQQKSRAAAVVEESLVRLGFPHAWMGLAEVAAQRGSEQDEFVYFSLDLAAHSQARVKIYLRHYDATLEDLEKAFSLAQNYVPGDVTEFCQALIPTQGAFTSKPMASCFAFVEGNDDRPTGATLCVPIGYYASSDRVVADSLQKYFSQHNLPISAYTGVLQSFATRSLDSGCGMHSHLSLRRENQQLRVTVYLNPEINVVRSFDLQTITNANWNPQRSIEEAALHYEDYAFTDHPFFQRLQREPVNPQYIWLLMMNVRGTSTNFTRRLANVVAQVDDERIRCLLAKQLNDELGNGNIDRIHRKLFERLMTAVEPWRIESCTENMLMPGKEISDRLEEIFLDSNPYVGVGATIVTEIHAKHFDLWLGAELRKTNVDLSAIKWVTVHEELEVDHANESLVLARYVAESEENVVVARQGIEKACMASWSFLNDMYRLCFA